jgi:methionyl-tRNA formyltransferase
MERINRVLFIGSKAIGLRCLKELHAMFPKTLIGILTLDDRSDSRSVYEELKGFGESCDLRFYVAKNRRHFEDLIRQLAPVLCVVVGWYWLIDRRVIQSVSEGFIGVHYSLLPRYRGGSPLVWQMVNGEETVGVSLFTLAEGLDDGDIWAQRSVSVALEDYVADVLEKLEQATVSILNDTYAKILNHRIKPVPQTLSGSTFCSPRIPEDGLIDWGRPCSEVYNFIRAQSDPYPGAYTFLNGKKLIVWRARPKDTIYYGTPGAVVQVHPEEGVYVVCGDHRPLVLETVEEEGSRVKEPAQNRIKSIKVRFPSI